MKRTIYTKHQSEKVWMENTDVKIDADARIILFKTNRQQNLIHLYREVVSRTDRN